jgi:hypothetical protein
MIVAPVMLHTLATLDPAQAEAALCQAIDHFLPNVGSVDLDPVARSLVDEVNALASPQNSPERILGDLLAELLLPPAEEAKSKDRIGERGDLPIAEYDLVFPADWLNGMFQSVGQVEVRRAMRDPVLVEHVHAHGTDVSGMTYVAGWATDDLAGPHLLLVVSSRTRSQLVVHNAWRLFGDLLPRTTALSAHSLLTGLTDRFGAKLDVSPLGKPRLLFWREVVAGKQILINSKRDSLRYICQQTVLNPEKGSLELVVAFCIELRRYGSYLALHNIISAPRG